MSATPWVHAWRDMPDDAELDAIVEQRAVPIDTEGLSLHETAELFTAAAKKIFLCDEQSRALIRQILDAGRTHARLNYPSKKEFDLRVSTEQPWMAIKDFAIGICGHTGVGKSCIVAAIVRLMAGRHLHTDTELLANLPLRPMWAAKVRNAGSVADILEQLLEDGTESKSGDKSERRPKRVAKQLKKLVRVRSYRNGVSVIVLDELQFGSKGSASDWISSLVLDLMGYGPLIIYVTNFSLMHKLHARKSEDKRRLLTNVTEVLPFASVTADWLRYLGELMSVLPDAWEFSVEEAAEEILKNTFGIRDNAVVLLREALKIARAKNPAAKVTMGHINLAYLSAAYASRRDDVEALCSVEGIKRRKDLFSPLRSRQAALRGTQRPEVAPQAGGPSVPASGPSTVVVAEDLINAHRKRVLDAMHDEQMQKPSKRAADREVTKKATRPRRAVVVPIRNSGGSDLLDDIIAEAASLIDQ